MKSVRQIFFRGLVTLLPIAITIYILYSTVIILENFLGFWLRKLLGENFYIPGLGFLLTLSLIFAFGLMLNSFILTRSLEALEKNIQRIPLIKAIYSPIKDLMNLFSKNTSSSQKVVLVRLGNTGLQSLGIVTREHFSDLPFTVPTQDKVVVFIPYSYGVGGFSVLVHKDDLTPIDLPVEKAMSLAITAWVKMDSTKSNETHNEISKN